MHEAVRKKIYSEENVDGSYMWVEKVLNYEGGDDYAIRLIHPNLTDTEGDVLTTNEVNSQGQKPYEEELAGIISTEYKLTPDEAKAEAARTLELWKEQCLLK